MKTILALFILALSSLAAPLPPAVPKRPLGVPADAKPFNGKWYKVYLEKKAWHAARDKCKELGGQLVTVPDAATWEFVKTLTPATVWLGATDEATEGVWVGIDSGSIKWAPAQPDNAGGVEHYAVIAKGQFLADIPKDGRVGVQGVSGFIAEWQGK